MRLFKKQDKKRANFHFKGLASYFSLSFQGRREKVVGLCYLGEGLMAATSNHLCLSFFKNQVQYCSFFPQGRYKKRKAKLWWTLLFLSGKSSMAQLRIYYKKNTLSWQDQHLPKLIYTKQNVTLKVLMFLLFLPTLYTLVYCF